MLVAGFVVTALVVVFLSVAGSLTVLWRSGRGHAPFARVTAGAAAFGLGAALVAGAARSSATLGSGSVFVGNILALTSVTVNTGVTVHGRALAPWRHRTAPIPPRPATGRTDPLRERRLPSSP